LYEQLLVDTKREAAAKESAKDNCIGSRPESKKLVNVEVYLSYQKMNKVNAVIIVVVLYCAVQEPVNYNYIRVNYYIIIDWKSSKDTSVSLHAVGGSTN